MAQSHGGSKYYDLIKVLPENKIFDLSISVNPYPLPFQPDLSGTGQIIKHYPDNNHKQLLSSIAEIESCKAEEILLTSGASEGILALCGHLSVQGSKRTACLVTPLYSGYHSGFQAFRIPVREFRMKQEEDFFPDVEAVCAEILDQKPSALVICNPCNPTGRLLSNEAMSSIEDHCHQAGTLLVIDESYRWLCDDNSPYSIKTESCFVIKSLTKEFGIPGLRMGFVKAKKNRLANLQDFIMPWSMSSFAIELALQCFAHRELFETQWKTLLLQAGNFRKELQKLGFKILKSESPFFLGEISDTLSLVERCYKDGLILRDCSSFGMNDIIRFGTSPSYEEVLAIIKKNLGKV